jgi:hypothetical protein
MTSHLAQQLTQLNAWYKTGLGRHILATERSYLERVLPKIFGYHLVQVGGPVDFSMTSSSPIAHQVHTGPLPTHQRSQQHVFSDEGDLPFLPNSVDLFVVPHFLECIHRPEHCIADICEALVMGGHVVVLGWNPYSLLALSYQARWVSSLPQGMHWPSSGALKQWFRRMNCVVQSEVSYFFGPPLKRRAHLRHSHMIDTIGQFLCPQLGGGYCIVFKKEAQVPQRVTKQWRRSKQFVTVRGLTEPANYDQG